MKVTPEQLHAHQQRALEQLVAHCRKYSPFYRRKLARHKGPGLPLLTRRELQQAKDIVCRMVPAAHGSTYETRTSGSTGEPVVVTKTRRCNEIWARMTMRFHEWYQTDYRLTLMSVKVIFDQVQFYPDWGKPANIGRRNGPSIGVPIKSDPSEIYRLASEHAVGDLLIFPSTLGGLVEFCRREGLDLPSLKRLRTVSETVSADLRRSTREVLGQPIIDIYSSNEVGNIALQCPSGEHYHTMDDALIVEVLDAEGQPCAPGEMGRVVVTDLNNYAMPIIRYDIGDFAVVGEACGCGRPFGTLRRVLGRERNLILMPDGSRVWPSFGLYDAREVAPISQYQVIQHSLEELEVRLVCERALTSVQENALAERIRGALGHGFPIRFVYYEGRLPTSPSGKFEEFVSHCR